MVKPPYYDRLHLKQALCTQGGDTRVATNVSEHETGNCTALPKKTGLRRCGRNGKTSWNSQRANLVNNNFSPEEEELVIKLHATIGSRWSIIAQQLPGRSDDDVKNLWNTKLKKKLSSMGIDPITHRPFSQILADYGNMGGIQKARTTRFGYLNRDRTNTFTPSSGQSFTPPEEPSSFNTHFSEGTALTEAGPSNVPFSAPAYDHSLDLLSQLQAIKMVTEASNYNTTASISSAQMPNECISSSASSTSAESSTNKALASPNFSWSDFLLVDAFLPANGQDFEEKISSSDHLKMKEAQELSAPINQTEDSSFSSGSFLENMIECEKEIFLETHDILDYY